MTESTQVTLLRRMTRSQGQEVADNPLTSSRAVRLALTKAANDTVGLVLTVLSVAEETASLDDMLGTLSDDLMLVALDRGGALVGLIALDMELRAAVLEMETMGAVLGQKAEERPPTRTDKALCAPLIDAFIAAFPAAVQSTPLEGWADDVQQGERLGSLRAAGLVLADCDYRVVRMTLDFGSADRQGHLSMILPLPQEALLPEPAAAVAQDWHTTFQATVSAAPASLDAVLHRFPISLAKAQGMAVGMVLPLPGCTVNSVRLVATDGQEVAQAKLGQAGGYRAVRLETAPNLQLYDLPAAVAEPIAAIHDEGMMGQHMAAPPVFAPEITAETTEQPRDSEIAFAQESFPQPGGTKAEDEPL